MQYYFLSINSLFTDRYAVSVLLGAAEVIACEDIKTLAAESGIPVEHIARDYAVDKSVQIVTG